MFCKVNEKKRERHSRGSVLGFAARLSWAQVIFFRIGTSLSVGIWIRFRQRQDVSLATFRMVSTTNTRMVLAIQREVGRRRRARGARESLVLMIELTVLVEGWLKLVMVWERIEYLLCGRENNDGQLLSLAQCSSGPATETKQSAKGERT